MVNLNIVSSNNKQGLFIAIESVDPYDSTLYSELLHTWLNTISLKTLYLIDPHGNITESESIYNTAKNFKFYERFELFLIEFLIRRTYLNKVVSPAVKNGSYVVVNGFVENTYADAMVTGNILYKDVAKADSMILEDCIQPDIVFVIDTPFSKSYSRAIVNPDHRILSTYEKELRTKYNRKRTEILIRATAQASTYVVIDGSESNENILLTIQEYLSTKNEIAELINKPIVSANKIY